MVRILDGLGIEYDADLLWRMGQVYSNSNPTCAVAMLNAGLDIAVGNVMRRLRDKDPGTTPELASQELSAIRDLRRSGADQILAIISTRESGALAGEITVRSLYTTNGVRTDPGSPLFIGVPPYMVRG